MSSNKNKINLLFLLLFVLSLSACGEMDETYRHFWDDGEKIYPAAADSLKMYSGKNRAVLSWIINGDPNITEAVILWENRSDSLVVPLQTTGGVDSISISIDDLQERTYSFDIYTYDNKGNRSIPRSIVGSVYGDVYANSLLNRYIMSAFYVDDTLTISWASQADESLIGTELTYKNLSTGLYESITVDNEDEITVIGSFDSSDPVIKYRTVYVPPMSIDTFYSPLQSLITKGPPVFLDRTGWTADASSFDNRGGSSTRPPSNMLTGNASLLWVNQVSPQAFWPHTFTIDMGSVIDEVAGISIVTQRRNETPKTINIFVSVDGENWELMGLFSMENIAGRQDFDFYASQDIRYYRVVGLQPWGNTNNIALVETYAYTY